MTQPDSVPREPIILMAIGHRLQFNQAYYLTCVNSKVWPLAFWLIFLCHSIQAIKPQQHTSMTLMYKLANIFGRKEAALNSQYIKVLTPDNDNCP